MNKEVLAESTERLSCIFMTLKKKKEKKDKGVYRVTNKVQW